MLDQAVAAADRRGDQHVEPLTVAAAERSEPQHVEPLGVMVLTGGVLTVAVIRRPSW
jgi:hypothetical protein